MMPATKCSNQAQTSLVQSSRPTKPTMQQVDQRKKVRLYQVSFAALLRYRLLFEIAANLQPVFEGSDHHPKDLLWVLSGLEEGLLLTSMLDQKISSQSASALG
jgi:hypothetical protein